MISVWNKDAYFPSSHEVVTFSNSVNMRDISPVYCNAAGDVAAVDKDGVVVVYTVTAGQFLPIKVLRINSTGTTVAVGSIIRVW